MNKLINYVEKKVDKFLHLHHVGTLWNYTRVLTAVLE